MRDLVASNRSALFVCHYLYNSYVLLEQTLRGHEHVIETLCYGRKPRDAAAIMAAAAAGVDTAIDGTVNDF